MPNYLLCKNDLSAEPSVSLDTHVKERKTKEPALEFFDKFDNYVCMGQWLKNEYSVRVSFLELYSEQICDLLSAHDDSSRLRLYEDATRIGRGQSSSKLDNST